MGKKLVWSGVFGALPLVVFGFSFGPPTRRTGAAVDGGMNCTECHLTYRPANSDMRGSVRIHASNYIPGQKQNITVQVYHPEAQRWGFQLTARTTKDETVKAGAFSASDAVNVVCDSGGNAPCGADKEFASHRLAATRVGASGLATFTVEWTAPTNSAGDVIFYAAGNAADGSGTSNGDRIYTTSIKISPASAGPALPPRPSVTSDGAVAALAFGGGRTIAPGSWIEIYGNAFTMVTKEWGGADFNGANAPKKLADVSVTIGGKDAFVRYVSPSQVNVQAPDGIGVGPVQVLVKNEGGVSDAITMTAAARATLILAPASFKVNGRQLVAALFADNVTFVAGAGEIPGVSSRPAKPGETIILYAIGAGATDAAVAAGTIAGAAAQLRNVTIRFGDAPATLGYAGLAPGFVGLYQFNVVVPNVASGDAKLVITIDGVAVAQDLTTVIGN